MAGKKNKRGSASAADAGYFPKKMFGISTAGMETGWKAAKGIFDPRRAEDALKSALPFADTRLAIFLFLAAGLLAFIFSVLTNIEMLYVLQIKASVYQELTSEELAVPDLSVLIPVTAFSFIMYVPLMALTNMLFEWLAFSLIRATGGKGKLGEHMLLASIIWLSISITTAANLLVPVDFWIIALAVLAIIGLLYLMVFMMSKAYSLVHGIGLGHAMAINILLIIIKLALWFYLSGLASGLLGATMEGV